VAAAFAGIAGSLFPSCGANMMVARPQKVAKNINLKKEQERYREL